MLVHDGGFVHQSAVLGQHQLVGQHVVDFFDVFGAQLVLVFAFGVFAVGVDEEHLVFQAVGLIFVAHDHTSRNASAIKQARWQADDGFDHVVVDQQFSDELFFATPEQHAVRHDGGHVPMGLEAGQHVLHKHEVGFFAGLGAPLTEAAGVLERGAVVVL